MLPKILIYNLLVLTAASMLPFLGYVAGLELGLPRGMVLSVTTVCCLALGLVPNPMLQSIPSESQRRKIGYLMLGGLLLFGCLILWLQLRSFAAFYHLSWVGYLFGQLVQVIRAKVAPQTGASRSAGSTL